ncbi:MAG TPA: hypothetical protein VMH38_00270 [Thermoplasmata archaeon]|nr:hypothetical protein [Thermoplasmata archaeon]
MTELTEQRLGYGFGLLGGALIALGGLVSLIVGTADLILGRPNGAISAASSAVVLFVVGGLAIFFAWLARHDWSARPLASGVLLVVLAVVGWAIVGIDASLLALVGSLFAFLAGVLFLIQPVKKAAELAVAA